MRCNCFYCRHCTDLLTYTHKWYLPFLKPFRYMWFFVPTMIYRRNHVRTEDNITELRPFHGLLFLHLEGGRVPTLWWKNIYFIRRPRE